MTEDQNGFVDVSAPPYPETIAGIREVGYRMYEIRRGRPCIAFGILPASPP